MPNIQAICLIALVLFVSACAPNAFVNRESITQELKSALSARMENGFSPLDYPVAVIVGGSTFALNGPCETTASLECENLPLVRPGSFLLRDKPGEYSVYGYKDLARTANLIAHEEFHFFTRSQASQFAVPAEPKYPVDNDEFSIRAAATLIGEINATMRLVRNFDEKNLACLRLAVDMRSEAFPGELSEYLEGMQHGEGMAKYVGHFYKSKVDGVKPEVQMLKEARLPAAYAVGDIRTVMRIVSYSLGGMKAAIAADQQMDFGYLVNAETDAPNAEPEHTKPFCDNDVLAKTTIEGTDVDAEFIVGFIAKSRRKLADLLASIRSVDVYKLKENPTHIVFSERHRLLDGSVLIADVSVTDEKANVIVDGARWAALVACDGVYYVLADRKTGASGSDAMQSAVINDPVFPELMSCEGIEKFARF